jgi:FtsH-binding integral membrane protein
MHASKQLWRAVILPVAWVVLTGEMVWVRHRDPFGRSPTHPGYGENLPGDLPSALLFSAIEVVVLSAILQPWRITPLWPRALATFAVFAPWSLFAMAMGMHAGSIDAAHTMWRFGIVLALGVVLLVSGVRALAHR